MDDGCYNLQHTLLDNLINRVNGSISINVIAKHAKARALQIKATVNAIAMSDVIDLTFKHNKVITWQ